MKGGCFSGVLEFSVVGGRSLDEFVGGGVLRNYAAARVGDSSRTLSGFPAFTAI